MKTPLVTPQIMSIYMIGKQRQMLPTRMAHCTPDMQATLNQVRLDVEAKGGQLFLSDLFRSYDMQLQSHLDYVNKKKKAFSPPPGGSMHEAGRALDLDLGSLKMPLKNFWPIAKKRGLSPIITTPDPGASEAWHFDCRGSHDLVYNYYASGKGTNMKPYTAMSVSGILSIGVHVDQFGNNQDAAALQCGLIRLGFELGNIDGSIGKQTREALEKVGIALADERIMLAGVEDLLRQKYPEEFGSAAPPAFTATPPDHVIS